MYNKIKKRILLTLETSSEKLVIAASYKLPSVKVNNLKAVKDFLDDDGGY